MFYSPFTNNSLFSDICCVELIPIPPHTLINLLDTYNYTAKFMCLP